MVICIDATNNPKCIILTAYYSTGLFLYIACNNSNQRVSGKGMTNRTNRILKIAFTILTITLVLVTLITAMVFVNRLTLSYNSEGRYFDESSLTVYHEQAIPFYGILFVCVLILTLLTFYKTRKLFYK